MYLDSNFVLLIGNRIKDNQIAITFNDIQIQKTDN